MVGQLFKWYNQICQESSGNNFYSHIILLPDSTNVEILKNQLLIATQSSVFEN